MKLSLYIENGITQIVLTPENDWEKGNLSAFKEGTTTVKIHHGEFFECVGGWLKQGTGRESLMIVMDTRSENRETET